MSKLVRCKRVRGKFKQGQTVYWPHFIVDEQGEWDVVMKRMFLYSHKEPWPNSGECITKMNESYLNWIFNELSGIDSLPPITTSRRKAIKQLDRMRINIKKGIYG